MKTKTMVLLGIGIAAAYMLSRKKSFAGLGQVDYPYIQDGIIYWSNGTAVPWGPWFSDCLNNSGYWAPDGSACLSVATGK